MENLKVFNSEEEALKYIQVELNFNKYLEYYEQSAKRLGTADPRRDDLYYGQSAGDIQVYRRTE